jgi:hypothetical protein
MKFRQRYLQESIETNVNVKKYITQNNLIPNDPKDPYVGLKPDKAKELAVDLLKINLEKRGHKLTPEIQDKFLNRFEPFWDYGTGDGLVYDRKNNKVVEVTHEADLENILKGIDHKDWWKDTGIHDLNIQPQSWWKKTFG